MFQFYICYKINDQNNLRLPFKKPIAANPKYIQMVIRLTTELLDRTISDRVLNVI